MLVYIAAPLGDPDPTVRAWHRERANLLSALVFACGGVPVCVHTYAELAIGADTDPEARAHGQVLSMAALGLGVVFKQDGRLWALIREDGTFSAGTLAELERWDSKRAELRMGHRPLAQLWSDWRSHAERHAPHLLPEFDRLATRPEVPNARAE